jgi:superfamily II DNA or RNA helicase
MNNYLVGKQYEHFIRQKLLDQTQSVWLWEDIPENHLVSSGIINDQNKLRLDRKKNNNVNINPLSDTGIDILMYLNGKYILVQCKHGYKNGVGINDLNGFFTHMFKHDDKEGLIYYTSKLTRQLSEVGIKDDARVKFIKLPMITKKQIDTNAIVKKTIGLHDYQVQPVTDCINHLKSNKRCTISFPCGTGKTIMSCYISRNFSCVVMISPLKQYAEQNITRFTEYFSDYVTLLIDSDGTRDINEINKFIKKNKCKKMLFSVTFKSVDILNQFIGKLDDYLCIVDEFHNLSRNNVSGDDEDNDIYKLLTSKHKILFVSATPRVYDLENTELEDDDLDNLFGKTVANMSFSTAIQTKKICDYRIFLPSVSEDYDENYEVNIKPEIKLKKYDKCLRAKCMFILKGMLDNNNKRCITYCDNTETMNTMKEILAKLSKNYYAFDLDIFTISYVDKHSKSGEKGSREWKLCEFQKTPNRTIMLSVQILDECVDIPKCDSIYISHVTNSKIRTVQRMCRCLRIDPENSAKVGHVYMWCDEYADILGVLSGIKEYDVDFKDKISVQTGMMRKSGVKMDVVSKDGESVRKYVVGVKEFKIVSWNEKLEMVKAYIDKNKKRPSGKDLNNIARCLGQWIYCQQQNSVTKIHAMKIKTNYDKWIQFTNSDKYSQYFLPKDIAWSSKLNSVKQYIDENKKRPSHYDKNENVRRLSTWITHQQHDCAAKKDWMVINGTYDKWTQFVNSDKYSEYFLSKDIVWNNKLSAVKQYIDDNAERPSGSSIDNDVQQLGKWINTQQTRYIAQIRCMSTKLIRDKWKKFIEDQRYAKYFRSGDTVWHENFVKTKKYIDENKKRPSRCDKNNDVKRLGTWISSQQKNYTAQKDSMRIKSNYDEWTNFINSHQYGKYFVIKNK